MTPSDAANTASTNLSPDARPGRERILEHARALFLERGYVDVSMREIAEAANLRKASIYHHFVDKEALFIEIMMAEITESRRRLTESVEGLTSLPDRLEELAFTHFSQSRSNSWRLAQDFRNHVPESRHDEIHKDLARLYEVYQSVFDDGAAAGEIEGVDPKFAASSFFHTVISWTWDVPDSIGTRELPPRELARTAVRMLLYGIASPKLRGDTGKASSARAVGDPGVETPG
jgi:AcrR family transcriptional regulator